jgi:uncharacterized protein (TIGR02271 family)
MAPTKDSIAQWQGQTLTGSDGSKIGKIGDIYLDNDTGQPEWALVNTGLFGGKGTFVPLAEATEQGGSIRVPYDKATVKDAPAMAPDGQLSQEEEAELYRYYGLRYEESSSDSGLPEGTTGRGQDPTPDGSPGVVGNDVSGPETDSAMTRSEEELLVGTTQREQGRARLRKYVVTEQVSTTVPVQREEVRVEREPITEANVDAAMSGGDITSEEHEVVLREEEAVVSKRVVPKERVRLDKDVVTEQREVGGEVRKEQIEFEEGQERQ